MIIVYYNCVQVYCMNSKYKYIVWIHYNSNTCRSGYTALGHFKIIELR